MTDKIRYGRTEFTGEPDGYLYYCEPKPGAALIMWDYLDGEWQSSPWESWDERANDEGCLPLLEVRQLPEHVPSYLGELR